MDLVAPFSPKTFLLCWFDDDKACILKQYALTNLITAAPMLLAKMWKTNSVPSLNEWRMKVHYIFFLMSKLSALNRIGSESHGPMENFTHHWSQYINDFFGMSTVSNG